MLAPTRRRMQAQALKVVRREIVGREQEHDAALATLEPGSALEFRELVIAPKLVEPLLADREDQSALPVVTGIVTRRGSGRRMLSPACRAR